MEGGRNVGKAILAVAVGVSLISLIVGCSVIRDVMSRPYLFGPSSESGHADDSLTKKFFSDVRLGKHNVESIYGFACYLQQRNQHQLALHEFQKILQIDSSYVKAYNGMGVSYDMLGEYETAVHCYRKALELNPNLDYVHNNLGYSYLLQGDPASATESFQKAIAMNDQETYRNNLHLARAEGGQSRGPAEGRLHADLRTDAPNGGLHSEGSETHMPRAPAHASHMAPVPEPSVQPLDLGAFPLGVRLEISNGNGINHMARNVGTYLIERGYDPPRLTNADHFAYEKSVIFYRDGLLAMASDVASHLPGWQEMEKVDHLERSTIGVKLLLGRDLIPYRTSFVAENGKSQESS
jgi:tetratricopeptide (TPR) repeat protein